MRHAIDQGAFTPLGIWVRQYLKTSEEGLSITNLDFIIEDFKNKKLQLLEEKQSGGRLHNAQALTFAEIDKALMKSCPQTGYDYWGFFVLQLKPNTTMPGPGMTLNGVSITCEQLKEHLNFEKQFCEPYQFKHRREQA